jgi:hypothetical protein
MDGNLKGKTHTHVLIKAIKMVPLTGRSNPAIQSLSLAGISDSQMTLVTSSLYREMKLFEKSVGRMENLWAYSGQGRSKDSNSFKCGPIEKCFVGHINRSNTTVIVCPL